MTNKQNKNDLEFIKAMDDCNLEDGEMLVQTKDCKLAEKIRRRLRSKVFELIDQDESLEKQIEIIFSYTKAVCSSEWRNRYISNKRTHWMWAAE